MNLDVSRLASALTLVALSACKSMESSEPAPCKAFLSPQDRAAITACDATWLKSVRASDWKAAAATYTTDAMLMPPNEPAVTGRAAIQKWYEAFPPIVSMDTVAKEIDGCCDVAYVRGTYSLVIAPPGARPIQETGKFLEIHHRQADGTWLMLRDMFSSDSAAPH